MLVFKGQKIKRLIRLYRQILGWFAAKLDHFIQLLRRKQAFISYKLLRIEFIRRIFIEYLKLKKHLYSFYVRYPIKFKLYTSLFLVLILTGFSYFIYGQLTQPNYQLTKAEFKLFGEADINLMSKSKFSYDKKSQNYYLNKNDLGKNIESISQNSITVGNSSSSAAYDLRLPSSLSKGVTVQDNKSGLAFTLTPEFATAPVKLKSNHLVYPISNISGRKPSIPLKKTACKRIYFLVSEQTT